MRYTLYDVMGNPFVYDVPMPPGREIENPPNWNWPSGGNFTNMSSLSDVAQGLDELASLHDTLLQKGQAIVSGSGASVTERHPTTINRRPWLDMPEGAEGFDPEQSTALVAVGSQVQGVCVTVPEGYDGVINGFNWNFVPTTAATFTQGSGDLQAQILRNGAVVRNYGNILMEQGCTLAPRHINPLRIYSGETICLVVNHIANALLVGNIITGFSGYFYPNAS